MYGCSSLLAARSGGAAGGGVVRVAISVGFLGHDHAQDVLVVDHADDLVGAVDHAAGTPVVEHDPRRVAHDLVLAQRRAVGGGGGGVLVHHPLEGEHVRL